MGKIHRHGAMLQALLWLPFFDDGQDNRGDYLSAGLAVLGYGLYLVTKHTGGLTVFVMSVGGYAALCGVLGLIMSCKQAPYCTTRIYVLMLMLGSLFELAVAIALKSDSHWTEKFFNQHACWGDQGCDDDTNRWIDDHLDRIFWVLLVASIAEFSSSLLACCYSCTHTQEDEDDYYDRYSSY